MKRKKICMISSSGGHYEQLQSLKKLDNNYDLVWITEKTKYTVAADFYLSQTGLKDKLFIFKMLNNLGKSIYIYWKEKPDFVVSTGTVVAIPILFLAKIFNKKIIYIETFARVKDGTRAGKLMYKFADLFIVQWESLLKIYPDAIYGGSIY